MALVTIDDLDVRGQTVVLRVDFNVPEGDDFRIRAAIPTIRSVLDRGGRLVLLSHLGRPKGDGFEDAFSLRTVAKRLEALLGDAAPRGVGFASLDQGIGTLEDGDVLLLENLRFDAGEKAGDQSFAARLAALGDIYCNDAFGTAHRAHASMVALPNAMKPKPCVAGLLLAEEVRFLRDVLEAPGRPFVAVMGGAKVSDKLGAIKNLVGRIDTLLVGGAMAYTLLKVLGHKVGSSLVEEERLDDAREIVRMIESSSTEMRLPIDHVCGRALSSVSPLQIVDGDIPEHWMGLDIGPQTTAEFTNVLRGAKTIVWNGPMGAFETMPFDVGTRQLALALAAATHNGATTIVGGGDTVAAVKLAGVVDRVGHVSTGGGASIRMLEGRALPGLEPLDEATAAV